ncbi:MAG TPA: S9 family peptidase [Actinomycetota bacterium]|nr:S9 family peptidase [Actinomycetota bacterium]
MDRDLRETPLYREIEEHFRKAMEPAFGTISGATDPAPSPDGRTVAFTGSKLEKLEGTPETRICLVDLESGDLREITGGPNHDRLPKWSPDGSRLAFLSDRAEAGRFHPYLLDSGRVGEAAAAPEVEGTVEYLAWSPDGSTVLLGVAGLGADRAGAEGSGTTAAGGDLPAWMPDVEGGDETTHRRRVDLWDTAAGTVRTISPEALNVWEAAWCGDGTIAAVASDGPGEETWYGSRLTAIDIATGEVRDVYTSGRTDRQIAMPAAPPGGGRLALIEALSSDRGVLAGDVVLIDPATGEATRVEADDTDVTWIAWRDDDRLFYAGQRGLDTVAGDIEAANGNVAELWANGESFGQRYPEAQPVGTSGFVAVLEGYERPPEIAEFRDGKFETVHSFAHEGSRYLAEVGGRLERVTWEAHDGREIPGLLIVPDGPGPHPLLVHVHGGPIWAYRNRWAMGYAVTLALVARGYAVLHPNPRGSTGLGQDYAGLVVGDMGGDDARDCLAGVEALVERGVADPSRIGVYGGSYGGFMSAWLPTISDRFAAAVAYSPVTDWYSQHWNSNIGSWDSEFLQAAPASPGGAYFDRSPVMFASKVRTPVLLTAGLQDRCTPPGQAIEMYRALREHGVESEVVIYPQEGHGVRQMPTLFDFCARTVAWFERFMPARAGGPGDGS